jgi:hypothetical protein
MFSPSWQGINGSIEDLAHISTIHLQANKTHTSATGIQGQGARLSQTLLQSSVNFSLSVNCNLTQRSIADKPSYGNKTKKLFGAPLTHQFSIAAHKLQLQKKPPLEHPKEAASAWLGGSKSWQKSSSWSASLCKKSMVLLRIVHVL